MTYTRRILPTATIASAIWLGWLSLLATLIWSADKGIEMADEGALLLGYRYPDETISSPHHFSLIVDHFFGGANLGVVGLRLLKLLLDTGAVSIFAFGLACWIGSRRKDIGTRPRLFVLLLPFIATANGFGYGLFGQTLSYNALNADALMVCYGLVLLQFAHQRKVFLANSALFGAGCCLGLDLFVKFSSSIPALAICLLAIACYNVRSPGRGVIRLMCLLAGYAAGMALFFALILPPGVWSANFQASVAAQSDSSHNPQVLFTAMSVGLGSLLAVAVPQLVASSWLFHLLYRRASRGAGGILATLVGALIVIVAVEETLLRDFGGPGRGTVLGFATIITALAGLSAAHAAARHIRINALLKQRNIAGIVAFLLIVPFIGALGSNLPALAAANQYMVFWTGAIAVVLLLLPWPDWAKHLIPVFWALPSVLVAAVVIEALIIYPYGLTKSLFAQTDHLATSGPLAGLRVDHATARFVREARLLVSTDGDDRPGRPIVAAYDLPGLVYMLGGVSPGTPWFFGDEPEQRLNCVRLRATRLHDLRRSVIITNPGVRPQFAQCLRAVGIAFPSDYHQAGLVKDPYNGHTIAIYVPRR